jgi:hypothetical protein
VVAFDLHTGQPRWSFRGAGANVFWVPIDGEWRAVVGIGQKSGVY